MPKERLPCEVVAVAVDVVDGGGICSRCLSFAAVATAAAAAAPFAVAVNPLLLMSILLLLLPRVARGCRLRCWVGDTRLGGKC